MFEPFKNKENEKDIIRAIVFEPSKHELRFYEFMLWELREYKNNWWVLQWYEFFDWVDWQLIKEWDILVNDTIEYGDPHTYHIVTNMIKENYEHMEPGSLPFINSHKWVIIQDDEWEMYVVTSRSTGHVVYETFFIEQYHQLVDEVNKYWLEYDSFYNELEKRTFTDIEDMPFIDLTTC